MRSLLPVDIDDLLHQRGVEGTRIEFKASWNEGHVADQVVRTICAFANDFLNVNGGFIVLGVEERSGTAVLPPKGLEPDELDAIERSVLGQSGRVQPECQVVPERVLVEGRHLLVLWVPGSWSRPHTAPESRRGPRKHYIRIGGQTVEAQGRRLEELLRTGKAAPPFDDRPAPRFRLEDLRATLVREFLREVRSGLLLEPEDAEVYRRMLLTAPMNGYEVPRNVALMFFSDDPERAFRGSRIEVVRFTEGGDLLEEQVFRGPLDHQLRDCVRWLEQWGSRRVQKVEGRAESETWVSYPFAAIEEAVGNAVHHRDYQNPEPTKVYLYPDRMEITSYPGPVPGLEPGHFLAGASVPPVPLRNRRVGELLKELRLVEARGTGLGKVHRAMEENGSPPARFEFDEGRSYFRTVLPIHPGALPVAEARSIARVDGLVLFSVGAESLRPVVEASLPDLDLNAAKLLVDFATPEYLGAESESFEVEAKRIRNVLRGPLEDPAVARLHLFYRGPIALGPLLGAILATAAKPVHVYHYHEGRYTRAYVLDRKFLKARD